MHLSQQLSYISMEKYSPPYMASNSKQSRSPPNNDYENHYHNDNDDDGDEVFSLDNDTTSTQQVNRMFEVEDQYKPIPSNHISGRNSQQQSLKSSIVASVPVSQQLQIQNQAQNKKQNIQSTEESLSPYYAISSQFNPNQEEQDSHIHLYKALFDVFDKDNSNTIDTRELHDIAIALKMDPIQVLQTVQELELYGDPESGARFNFPDFVQILKALEGLESSEARGGALISQRDMSNNNAGYEQMLRKEFGNMMPRSGVYFMPDFKVIAYIRQECYVIYSQ